MQNPVLAMSVRLSVCLAL